MPEANISLEIKVIIDAWLARLRDESTRVAALIELAQAMERIAIDELSADIEEWNAQCQ